MRFLVGSYVRLLKPGIQGQSLRWMISRETTVNTGTPFVLHIGSGENPAPTGN
jgi:hypothetical protein